MRQEKDGSRRHTEIEGMNLRENPLDSAGKKKLVMDGRKVRQKCYQYRREIRRQAGIGEDRKTLELDP